MGVYEESCIYCGCIIIPSNGIPTNEGLVCDIFCHGMIKEVWKREVEEYRRNK